VLQLQTVTEIHEKQNSGLFLFGILHTTLHNFKRQL
jgi:hypothetical protein